jgi:hypothetical protein
MAQTYQMYEEALRKYLASASAQRLRKLRESIELPLVDRLAILSVNRTAISSAIDKMFQRFAAEASAQTPRNWFAWMVAFAMSYVVEIEQTASWMDRVLADVPGASTLERRALVFRAVLRLEGSCQWRLLRSVSQAMFMPGWFDCHRELVDLLGKFR